MPVAIPMCPPALRRCLLPVPRQLPARDGLRDWPDSRDDPFCGPNSWYGKRGFTYGNVNAMYQATYREYDNLPRARRGVLKRLAPINRVQGISKIR